MHFSLKFWSEVGILCIPLYWYLHTKIPWLFPDFYTFSTFFPEFFRYSMTSSKNFPVSMFFRFSSFCGNLDNCKLSQEDCIYLRKFPKGKYSPYCESCIKSNFTRKLFFVSQHHLSSFYVMDKKLKRNQFLVRNPKQMFIKNLGEMVKSMEQLVRNVIKQEKNERKLIRTREKAEVVKAVYPKKHFQLYKKHRWGHFFKVRQKNVSVRRFWTTSPLADDIRVLSSNSARNACNLRNTSRVQRCTWISKSQ